MIKKIIFDLDNTLLFISPEWEKSYQKFVDKYRLKITPKELFSCIGTFENDINNVIVTNKIMCEYINSKLPISLTENMFIELLDVYKNIPLINTDIVYNVLEYLSHKYELIVYTNWFSKNQMDRLKKYNLDKFFSKIYGWDVLEIKPSIIGIEKIIGNNKIDEYLFIGDNIELDLETPHNMGMPTIFFNRKFIKQNQFQEVFNLVELKSIL